MIKFRIIMILYFVMVLIGGYGFASDNDKIIIKEDKDGYVLTVPQSQLTMVIPQAYFTRHKEINDENPRYFMFGDQNSALFLSGWFESSESFSNAKQIWTNDVQAWAKNNLPSPQNVKFSTYDNWQIVTYDIETKIANNCHIRAHWVQGNTWIDIHLSMTSNSKKEEIRKKLDTVFKNIKIMKK
jgi:hypothetical protein